VLTAPLAVIVAGVVAVVRRRGLYPREESPGALAHDETAARPLVGLVPRFSDHLATII
jgi:hypothetical protein